MDDMSKIAFANMNFYKFYRVQTLDMRSEGISFFVCMLHGVLQCTWTPTCDMFSLLLLYSIGFFPSSICYSEISKRLDLLVHITQSLDFLVFSAQIDFHSFVFTSCICPSAASSILSFDFHSASQVSDSIIIFTLLDVFELKLMDASYSFNGCTTCLYVGHGPTQARIIYTQTQSCDLPDLFLFFYFRINVGLMMLNNSLHGLLIMIYYFNGLMILVDSFFKLLILVYSFH